jgi:hypothetical protein
MTSTTAKAIATVGKAANVAAGHVAEMAGAAAKAAGCPLGKALEKAGRAWSDKAVEVANRDGNRIGKAVFALLLLPSLAWAGSPHFTSCTPTFEGPKICVTGVETGLGNETQVDLDLSLVAHCENEGGNAPSAQNKETFVTDGVFPVQNGRAPYSLCVIPTFQPACDKTMTVVVDAVLLVDAAHKISCSVTLD